MKDTHTQLTEIHHLTAITGNAPRNHDFYTRTLGMRLVKKTVNSLREGASRSKRVSGRCNDRRERAKAGMRVGTETVDELATLQ